jgi:hypothetical protein
MMAFPPYAWPATNAELLSELVRRPYGCARAGAVDGCNQHETLWRPQSLWLWAERTAPAGTRK